MSEETRWHLLQRLQYEFHQIRGVGTQLVCPAYAQPVLYVSLGGRAPHHAVSAVERADHQWVYVWAGGLQTSAERPAVAALTIIKGVPVT